MTLEQEYDYKALVYSKNNPRITATDIINYLSTLVGNSQAPQLHKKYTDNGYFTVEHLQPSNLYSISEGGEVYIKFLQKEIDKEDIDFKLKKISLSSIGFNKYFPSIAVGVAILSIIVPILLRQCDKDQVVTYKFQPEQLQLIIKSQERNTKSAQEVHHGLGVDSLLSHE